jgi:hypothetical protein
MGMQSSRAVTCCLASEVALLYIQAKQGPERRGLLRLQALALAGQAEPDAVLRFSGD